MQSSPKAAHQHAGRTVPARDRAEPSAPLTLGTRLRTERVRHGLSLRALARAVNLSASFVSQIENDKARPSVSTLYALCQQLDVSVDSLIPVGESDIAPAAGGAGGPASRVLASRPHPFADSAHEQHDLAGIGRGRITPHGSGRRIELDSGVSWERLGGSATDGEDFLLVTYAPGGSSSTGGEKLMRHSGHEFGYVLDGTLNVELGFDEYVLGPGDSISYDSATPHRLFNQGGAQVRALWLVLPSRPTLDRNGTR